MSEGFGLWLRSEEAMTGDGSIAAAHEWKPGRWIVRALLARELWFQDSGDGRHYHWLRVGCYVRPESPSLRVFTVIAWRLKVSWGRAA